MALAVALVLSVGARDAYAGDSGAESVDAGATRSSVVLSVVPEGVQALEIVVDDRPLKPESLGRTLSVAPGAHTISARGVLGGARMSANQSVTLTGGAHADVRVVMVKDATEPAALTRAQIACMKVDQTPEEAAACLCGADDAPVGQRPGCHACALGSESHHDRFVALAVASVLALALRRRRS